MIAMCVCVTIIQLLAEIDVVVSSSLWTCSETMWFKCKQEEQEEPPPQLLSPQKRLSIPLSTLTKKHLTTKQQHEQQQQAASTPKQHSRQYDLFSVPVLECVILLFIETWCIKYEVGVFERTSASLKTSLVGWGRVQQNFYSSTLLEQQERVPVPNLLLQRFQQSLQADASLALNYLLDAVVENNNAGRFST